MWVYALYISLFQRDARGETVIGSRSLESFIFVSIINSWLVPVHSFLHPRQASQEAWNAKDGIVVKWEAIIFYTKNVHQFSARIVILIFPEQRGKSPPLQRMSVATDVRRGRRRLRQLIRSCVAIERSSQMKLGKYLLSLSSCNEFDREHGVRIV